MLDRLSRELAQRVDERVGIGGAGPEVGADLDEGGRQHIGGIEQQIANLVGVARLAAGDPPPLDEFDLDVSEPVIGRSSHANL